MKRIIYVAILLALAVGVYVYAYPRLAGDGSAAAQQRASGGGGGGGRGGAFATAVVTAVAQKEAVPITKTAVGYVEPAQSVILRARADGTVTEVDVADGQTVKAGDLLIKLDDRALQATIAKDQAQIAKDQANADAAKAVLEREQDLVKKSVDPQSSLDAATAAAKAADATVTVDNAQLQADQVALSYMTITAPIAGRVGVVNTSVGNVVHASDTSTTGLLTITAMDLLRVSFSVAESDLDNFRSALTKAPKGLPVDVTAPGDKSPRATANLNFIDSSVDTSSGTIVLKADLPNPGLKLWPGQYVTANTKLGAYENATTIPLQAVQQSNEGSFVYAVGANDKVKRQTVTVVATVGDKAIVGSELKPGQHVVTEGQLRLTDGATVRETVSGTDVASADNGNAPAAAAADGTSVTNGSI